MAEAARRAREKAELAAAQQTAQAGDIPLTHRRLSGDAISEAGFSDDEYDEYDDYELLEPGDLDMFELAEAAEAAEAAGAPARECSPEKITAKQSESKLAKEIFDILKKVSMTQKGVITEQEERHLEAMTDRVGCSNLCDIMGGIGIDHAKIEEITDDLKKEELKRLLGELDKLRSENNLSPLTRDSKTRVGIRKGKTCAKRKAEIKEEIEILNGINKSITKGEILDREKIKLAIEQLQDRIDTGKIKPTDADIKTFNKYVVLFRDYISKAAKKGGNRARRVRRTKRTKGKSRGRAGKATRVRRNNNNSNKTKRNKGKKRRTKRA